jgi:hypothetical protein
MDDNDKDGFWGFCGKECPSDPHDGINVIFLDKDFPSTVKPVYNSHPWDLKNVVVMQRIL